MISTYDQMASFMPESNATLVAAIIGVIGALLGVIVTLFFENKRRRKETIDRARPIIINYLNDSTIDNSLTTYTLKSDTCDSDNVFGSFKNTDNGILFLDYVDLGNKRYTPQLFAVVDTNTAFSILLQGTGGASFDKPCKLVCHDIFGNKYSYSLMLAKNNTKPYNDLILSDGIPKRMG